MPYQITDVDFDFSDDAYEGPVPASIQALVRGKAIGKVYHVEHPDYLADEVSEDTGWCVLSLAYSPVEQS